MKKFYLSLIFFFVLISYAQAQDEVVIYTSLDQVFSEPVLKGFEQESGIKVRVVYDVEATKTTGLVNRLIAEKDLPQADVFWNSEIARTILLKNKGILEPYVSPQAEDIPAAFKDKNGYWSGFAARARVIVYNTDQVKKEDAPKSILDLTQPRWKDKAVMAYPLFGTTSTQAAALFALWGDQEAEAFFRRLTENGILVVDGNSTSRDRVQAGEVPVGITDSDDANIAVINKKPLAVIYPDQGENEMGTLLIPNTVALIKKGPHPANAKKLIDYLLSKETESKLSFMDGGQIPLRDGVQRPDGVPSYHDIKTMNVNFETVSDKIESSARILQGIFLR